MFAIVLLSIYVIFYSRIRSNPNEGAARFLRKGLPVILLAVAGYFFVEKLKYGYVPTVEQLNGLIAIDLIQGYAALWLVHVLTSTTWILSRKNPSPWLVLPWQKGGCKLMGLIWNGFLSIGLIPFLAIHITIIGAIYYAYSRIKAKRAQSVV